MWSHNWPRWKLLKAAVGEWTFSAVNYFLSNFNDAELMQ